MVPAVLFGRVVTEIVFQSFFSKKLRPLTGAPSVRRLKTYSAQTGYVYQYLYEGQRSFAEGRTQEAGAEFVFRVSSDGKTWRRLNVYVGGACLSRWEQAQGRVLSSTERYAMAKMALFGAFEEGGTPAQIRPEVRVRASDVARILEILGIATSSDLPGSLEDG